MSAQYVRSRYGVAFKRGDRVIFDGKPGTVVSFPGQYVGVRLDGDQHTSHCHPTWRLTPAPAAHTPARDGAEGSGAS